jgi:ADP-ribosylglycohydrolase
MSKLVLDRADFRDKVYACWMGKNIGGTLGGPWEDKQHTHDFSFYEPVPDEAQPNDDLDLQLVWLKMLEDCGIDPSVRTFAEYWNRYAKRYPWNEYGFFMRNFERGLVPPIAGCFENYYVDEMGSPIRSEIWACLHPGDPQAAARMAWKDSAVDHAGGEGMHGEMFWSALQAAAFVESDPKTLIQIGLNMIPLASHIARSIREALWCYETGKTWGEARERIVTRFGHIQSCNAVPNHGFTIIGWLYGKDFGDCLCKAVNCGYDTDCTGATLGATLGIITGMAGIPDEWVAPIGDRVILYPFTEDCDAPKTIDELTDRSIAMAEKAVATKDDIAFGDTTQLPADLLSRFFRAELAHAAGKQDCYAAVELLGGRELWLHYGGDPVLRPGITRDLSFTSPDGELTQVELAVPADWSCERLSPTQFRIGCEGDVPGRNVMTATVDGQSATFTILGPEEAKGFGAGINVEYCKGCWTRIEACMCDELAAKKTAE